MPSHDRIFFPLRSFDDEVSLLLLLLPLRLCETGAVIFHGLRRGLIEIASATSVRLYLALLPPLSLRFTDRFISPGHGNISLVTPMMMIWRKQSRSSINIYVSTHGSNADRISNNVYNIPYCLISANIGAFR